MSGQSKVMIASCVAGVAVVSILVVVVVIRIADSKRRSDYAAAVSVVSQQGRNLSEFAKSLPPILEFDKMRLTFQESIAKLPVPPADVESIESKLFDITMEFRKASESLKFCHHYKSIGWEADRQKHLQELRKTCSDIDERFDVVDGVVSKMRLQ